jgi:hypothetical protein
MDSFVRFFSHIIDENNRGIKYDKVGGKRNDDQMDDRWIDG